jgi:hypothetical protein
VTIFRCEKPKIERDGEQLERPMSSSGPWSADDDNGEICTKRLSGDFLRQLTSLQRTDHRLSINRPTKRGKENSRSDGHCQCEKEMEVHLLACQ